MRFSTIATIFLILLLGIISCQTESGTPPPLSATSTLRPSTNTPPPTTLATVSSNSSVLNPNQLPTYTPASVSFLPQGVTNAVNDVYADRIERGDNRSDLRVINVKTIYWRTDSLQCNSSLLRESNLTNHGYRIVLADERNAYVYRIDRENDVLLWCRNEDILAEWGDPILFDPIVESLVDLSRTNLAQRLGVTLSDVQWSDFVAVTWPNSSLGCPVEGASYNPVLIDGYLIIMRVDQQLFYYHADGISSNFCSEELRQLPSLLEESVNLDPATVPTVVVE